MKKSFPTDPDRIIRALLNSCIFSAVQRYGKDVKEML